MKTILIVAFLTLLVIAHARASSTNLIANGGFETGNLNGWTLTGTSTQVISGTEALDGSYSAVIGSKISSPYVSDTLSQTFETVPGSFYVVQFSTGNSEQYYGLEWSLTGADGNPLVTNGAGLSQTGSVATYTSFFIANGNTATISFYVNSYFSGPTVDILDNVSVEEAAFSYPGKYSMKVVRTGSFQGQSLSVKTTQTGKAIIDSSGRIYYVQNDGGVYDGFVQDDGNINLHNETGVASIEGNSIIFTGTSTFNSQVLGAVVVELEQYTFKRIGN